MDKNVLRVGIVGCGKIAQTRHIPEYAATEKKRKHHRF
jgi:predicted dehydrogenase